MLRWRLGPLLILAACLLTGTGASAADRRVALVIGNSAYRSVPVLANPGRDASAMAEMLRRAGFESVDLRQDLGTVELKRTVREFMQTSRDADVAVVFFAGHGIEVAGVNYLIPTDARLRTDFDVEDEGLSLERVIRAIEPARRLRLVILDACRNNPFNVGMQRMVSIRGVANGLAKVDPLISDTLVAFAAKAGSVADDGGGDHSPFTTAMLKHLAAPGLDVRVAFGRVRDEVLRLTGGKQEPFVYGSLGGATMALVPDVRAADPEGDPKEMRRDYEFAERVGTREAWSSFLAAHPAGFYADLARAQVAKLTGSPAAPPAGEPARRPLPQTRPVGTDPATAAVAPGPAASPPGAEHNGACQREAQTLARLRATRAPEAVLRFEREFTCEALRPQLARLIEAVRPPAPPSVLPDPIPPIPGEPLTTSTARATPGACEREAQILAQLRNSRDVPAIDRFARDLSCQELRPQLQRLRESVGEE
ncbi:peptidase C14 caspase catalytic subunit p20 [Methylobacterium sp. 4-46]|uniref:caspase family protein n=1 Tax=unclassified Methylobacterium TaxID=2615210 RepID=UPI000152D380|nr:MULTISPECIES: caspase family protein [Methylobacterium]ACA19357.1 peptidase C14 caspase catalytic subunit p20 [Methylobacterium sp. 4-46]WFT78555.1 caspase family protein [Methylobacterium nodulans]